MIILDWKHECTKPRATEYPFSSLPIEVQKEISNRELDREKFLRCSYCGDIWIKEEDYFTPVGIKELGKEQMNWVILKHER